MKRFILFLFVSSIVTALFAQVNLPEHNFVVGSWSTEANRVYQNDIKSGLAKVNIKSPQSGPMLYEFNVRYESGAEDGHGGFGLHVFEDSAYNGKSWGAGKSWLLWLNYDEHPLKNSGIPTGLSGQIYRSLGNSRMELVQSIDLNEYADLLTFENLAYPVPFKIYVNGNTGEIRIYDPTDATLQDYYYFNIDKKYLPLKGDWVSIRTNGIQLSFAPGLK